MTREEIKKELAEINTLAYQKAHTATEVFNRRTELYKMLDEIAKTEKEARLTVEERNAENLAELENKLFCIRMADHYTGDTYKVITELEKKIEEMKKRGWQNSKGVL